MKKKIKAVTFFFNSLIDFKLLSVMIRVPKTVKQSKSDLLEIKDSVENNYQEVNKKLVDE